MKIKIDFLYPKLKMAISKSKITKKLSLNDNNKFQARNVNEKKCKVRHLDARKKNPRRNLITIIRLEPK